MSGVTSAVPAGTTRGGRRMLESRWSAMQPHPTVELIGRPLNEIESKYAPAFLYAQGDRSLLSPYGVRVSLVGSRKATAEGLRRTKKLARSLAKEGIVIVSGLAEGIDTAAHLAAMEAGGTIAVLGTGLDRYYPVQNRELQIQIAQKHLVLSQFPPGSAPRKQSFPQRNRTMALISDATVIIEAGEKSGSHHQGWEALRLGRPLFVLQSTLEMRMQWAEEMLKYGAKVLEGVDDVLGLIPSPALTSAASAF
jgi:DNA processing protein